MSSSFDDPATDRKAPDGDDFSRLLRIDPQRYAGVVQKVSAYGIHLIDREGLIRSWNEGAATLTGLSEAAVLGRPYATLFTEAGQREGLPQRTLQLARTNHHHRDEQPRRRADGEALLVLSTLDTLRQPSGELDAFIAVFADITEAKRREAALLERATQDPLTGLAHRSHFQLLAEQELERARRFAEPLSLALLDLDHFRRIHESHGRDAADQALRHCARLCGEALRPIDCAGRTGSHQFALLLPRTGRELAFERLQRLRLQVMESRLHTSGGELFTLTASIGLVTLGPQTPDLSALLRYADAMLYRAQREGGNRVETWFE